MQNCVERFGKHLVALSEQPSMTSLKKITKDNKIEGWDLVALVVRVLRCSAEKAFVVGFGPLLKSPLKMQNTKYNTEIPVQKVQSKLNVI